MPRFKVILSHAYAVQIQAQNAEDAKRLAEYFIYYSDQSTSKDHEELNFMVEKVELLLNDAIEVEDMENETSL